MRQPWRPVSLEGAHLEALQHATARTLRNRMHTAQQHAHCATACTPGPRAWHARPPHRVGGCCGHPALQHATARLPRSSMYTWLTRSWHSRPVLQHATARAPCSSVHIWLTRAWHSCPNRPAAPHPGHHHQPGPLCGQAVDGPGHRARGQPADREAARRAAQVRALCCGVWVLGCPMRWAARAQLPRSSGAGALPVVCGCLDAQCGGPRMLSCRAAQVGALCLWCVGAWVPSAVGYMSRPGSLRPGSVRQHAQRVALAGCERHIR